jgi:PAS domain S-box-containing protein
MSRQKAMETALKETGNRLLQAQRLANIGNWSVDLSFNLLSASDEFYRIFGIPREEFPASFEAYLDRVHPDDRERVRLTAFSMPEKSIYNQTEYRIIRTDHTLRTVRLNMEVVTDDAGQPVRIDGTIQDVTAQREAEEEKLALERKFMQRQKIESLGALAGAIAHDFNNILMAMLGNLELALREIPEGSKTHALIGKAIKSGRLASDLTSRMLAYTGKKVFMMKETNLNDIVRTNEELFCSSVSEKISIIITPARELPPINADDNQLLQAVSYLLINAAEAIGQGPGIITISTGLQEFNDKTVTEGLSMYKPLSGVYAWVEVSDTGCGMDQMTQQQIFDPFFSTKFTGRGLGMTACLGIVRAHSGSVLINSKPGQGTTVRLLFPVKKPEGLQARKATAQARHAPVGNQGKTILVADDEECVRELCIAFVEQNGYAAVGAADGIEALRLFRENADSISLVILNMQMPNLDGIQTFHELKKIRPNVRVLFSSGYNEAKAMKSFPGDRPAGYIQKPFMMQELLGKIDQVMKVGMENSGPK